MKSEVGTAIEELERSFPGHALRYVEDGEGGAYVIVEDLNLGDRYAPSTSWVGFHITHPYPDAEVYPYFLRGDLLPQNPADGTPTGWPEAMAAGHKMPGFDLNAIQVSRKSNRWNPERDTAASKLARVLEWIRTRP